MYEYTAGQAAPNTPVQTDCFYGLNRLRKGVKGELESMKNMSGREFPCAAPRGERVKICDIQNVQAVCAPDSTDTTEITGFTGIADEKFIYNGVVKSDNIRLSMNYEWSIIRLGNLYILNGYANKKSVMYYYNVDTVKFKRAGTGMDNLIVTAGTDKNGSYLETFRYGYNKVRSYSFTNAEGDMIYNSDFFKDYCNNSNVMGAKNIFESVFKVGDEVTITGFPPQNHKSGAVWYYNTSSEDVVPQTEIGYPYNNTVDTDIYASIDDVDKNAVVTAFVKSFHSDQKSVLGNQTYTHRIYFDLYNKDGEPVSFNNMVSLGYEERTHYCSGVSVKKRARCFDHITVHDNRLWGTTPTGNTIYASASDDPFSFTSGDINKRFAARLVSGSEGTFTGLCEYGGNVIAFKENSITVIYGSNASSYKAENVTGLGCTDPKSIAVTPSGVLFLSHNGFYKYNGTASPSRFSGKLNCKYRSAVGGWDGMLYYAAAVRADGARELLVYDTSRGLWHLHDDMEIDAFFRFRGGFYMVGSGGLYEQTDKPGTVEWEMTSVRAADNTLDNKAVNEIWILCDMAEGAYIKIWTSVDNGEFILHRAFAIPGLNVIRCPVRAVNGTMYRCRITGAGDTVIYNIEIRKAESEGRNHTEKAIVPPEPTSAETY